MLNLKRTGGRWKCGTGNAGVENAEADKNLKCCRIKVFLFN